MIWGWHPTRMQVSETLTDIPAFRKGDNRNGQDLALRMTSAPF